MGGDKHKTGETDQDVTTSSLYICNECLWVKERRTKMQRDDNPYLRGILNPFAIMLPQLKTVVLIKNTVKLAFFRLVEYLEHQHLWV